MNDARIAQIEALLRSQGLCSAADLAMALGVSQPTVSRLIASMGPRILQIGRARATRYALTRDIARAGSRWPLYRLDDNGTAQRMGILTALHSDRFHFEAELALPAFLHGQFQNGLFPGLPWFLDIQRPQGFLGRSFARGVAADIHVPPDLARWKPEDVLLALLRHGEDEAGDLVLGEHCLQLAQMAMLSPQGVIKADGRLEHYPRLAEEALQGDIVGSSAGGEQPKFTATLSDGDDYRTVIVKFSDRIDTANGRRWADLLRAETVAGRILQAHGIPSARCTAFEAGGRIFMESTRFDRTAVLGRRGLIHLAAIDAAFYGHGDPRWQTFADELERDNWIDTGDADALRVIGWFGDLIANNDMHAGNIGLHLSDQRPLRLAPVYDMLPMRFRPSANGEVVAREYEVRLPLPEQRSDWRRAAVMALDFWQAILDDPDISGDFQRIAEKAKQTLGNAARRF